MYLLTAGLDLRDLRLYPTDVHLLRLAGMVPFGIFDKFIIHLGLSNMSWQNILEQYRIYGLTVIQFLALCEWRCMQHKDKKMMSFKDLSDALTAINYSCHILCEVGNN